MSFTKVIDGYYLVTINDESYLVDEDKLFSFVWSVKNNEQ